MTIKTICQKTIRNGVLTSFIINLEQKSSFVTRTNIGEMLNVTLLQYAVSYSLGGGLLNTFVLL